MTDSMPLFSQLPDDSTVWIHVSSRPLTDSEAEQLQTTVTQFTSQWTSHERPVLSDWKLIDKQILVLAAFVSNGDLSGCGIDKHQHILANFANTNTFEWAGPLSVTFRGLDQRLRTVSRSAFATIVKSDMLPDSTIVVDQSISNLSAARTGIEVPASSSWHGRHFPFTESVSNAVLD